MLSRQPLWLPVLTHSPKFSQAFAVFLKGNPVSTDTLSVLRITPENIFVALEEKDVPASFGVDSKRFSYKMAFPVTVAAEACDMDVSTGARALSVGFVTSMCDTCNSMHIMERLLPLPLPHVSVVLHTEQLRPYPGVAEGEKLVVVSTVDKMGKRLVYCKTDVYVDRDDAEQALVQREKGISTLAELDVVLGAYEKVLTSTHIKNILPNKKWG